MHFFSQTMKRRLLERCLYLSSPSSFPSFPPAFLAKGRSKRGGHPTQKRGERLSGRRTTGEKKVLRPSFIRPAYLPAQDNKPMLGVLGQKRCFAPRIDIQSPSDKKDTFNILFCSVIKRKNIPTVLYHLRVHR